MSRTRTDTTPAPRDPTPLVVEGLVKRYNGFTAVDGVDLTVRDREIFALLGPNGAGKTTLIHCIAGMARQSAGRIRVFGWDTVRDFRATRRLVGLVPQEINFDPFFTPTESLLMGVAPDRGRAEGLLRLFSLFDQRDAYTRTLSGGMKRRLLVAKALVHRPRLLFLDEPTAGVDVELRRDLWRVVRRLRDEGTTIILTTHYLEEAEELSDRIGVIHHGRLLLVDDRDALLRRHRNARVRLLLPAPLPAPPPGLPAGARLERDGTCVVVPWDSAADLQAVVAAVRQVVEPLDVRVEQTRLEDIFVDLVATADGRPDGGAPPDGRDAR
jgi:ABC-2 type transport system ATP-binding protein